MLLDTRSTVEFFGYFAQFYFPSELRQHKQIIWHFTVGQLEFSKSFRFVIAQCNLKFLTSMSGCMAIC